jgi:hypothetical protein
MGEQIIVTEVTFDTKGCVILCCIFGLTSIAALWIVYLIVVYVLGGLG